MDVRHHRRLPGRPPGGSLARPGDRIEALVLALLLAAGLATVGLGAWAGNATADALSAGPRAGEYAATATATEASYPVIGPGSDAVAPMRRVPVAWPTPDGATGHGTVLLHRDVAAGEPVPVVVDTTGRPRTGHEPGGRTPVTLTVAVPSVLAGWLLLALLWLATESVVARRRASAWEAEWERIEPLWSGRSR
ncbi:Rv1733c family protein [Pseudonocardia acaciae]|uniref:Rv1733c family protein n=1 Tax=Pseudonocardia acaciae TaxID=551276 RepID=UPI00048D7C2D|nr:hypothetical protein [Pseudonocardia acaciae]